MHGATANAQPEILDGFLLLKCMPAQLLSGILMNHGLESTDAFTKLVEYGPAALPFLLGGYRSGAVLRLGYYFPEKSEALLLELLAKLDSPEAGEGESEGDFSSYENIELLEAIVASRNEAVQERVFAIMKTTRDASYFFALSRAYGKEHDSLILQRTKDFMEALPETDNYDSTGISLLRMLRGVDSRQLHRSNRSNTAASRGPV